MNFLKTHLSDLKVSKFQMLFIHYFIVNDDKSKEITMATNKQNRDSDHNEGQGFAGMDPKRQREIASEGGRAAHESGNAHEFDSEEAREAGRQSHKNDDKRSSSNDDNNDNRRGGSHEQHVRAGQKSHKNDNK